MPVAGSIETVTLTLAVAASDTVATLRVIAPDDGVSTVEAFPVPDTDMKVWRARVPYTMAGVYTFDWQVSGTGEGRPPRPARVAVGPAVAGIDRRHTYANTRDLAEYLGEAPPLDAATLLRDASAQVDDLLLCAVYPVDEDGMPTEPEHIVALRDATCAVTKWRADSGYDATAGALITSASIAGVSLGFKQGGGDAPPDGTGNEARQILREAGLLGGSGPWY